MLPTTLNTSEVKNSSGTEIEFGRIQTVDRQLTFAASLETPNLPHRILVSHLETGEGISRRRRSLVRVDKTIAGQVDTTQSVKVSFYAVADIPVGQMTAFAEAAHVNAELISFLASLGASTTILYDGTGNGSASLINGTL